MKTFRISTVGLVFAFQIFLNLPISSQEVIYLTNPSFEDKPRKGGEFSLPIKGWHDCGLSNFPGESPPDIHPVLPDAWGVTTWSFDLNTYLGLVIRYNDTYESVSQLLSTPLEAGQCYSFSLAMARDENYTSATQRSQGMEMFTTPAILKIWGGSNTCDNKELIAQSLPVTNKDWIMYNFIFKPKQELKTIILEAYYDDSISKRYNGHILIDRLSPIVMIPCE